MTLPIVDPFNPPYEVWQKRNPTLEEMNANGNWLPVKDQLLGTVFSALGAANYTATNAGEITLKNRLDGHITDFLKNSADYKAWQNAMPSKTPNAIAEYQKNSAKSDPVKVNGEIAQYGKLLGVGQCLFHGGLWWGGPGSATTQTPLSTSLSPIAAIQNALHGGKAYNDGRLDLIVLKTTTSKTNAFVFKSSGTNLGHELEVLLAAGTPLTFVSEACLCSAFEVEKVNDPIKTIPIYVVQVAVG